MRFTKELIVILFIVSLIATLVVAEGFNEVLIDSPENHSNHTGDILLNVTVSNPDTLANATNATFTFFNATDGELVLNVTVDPDNELLNLTFNYTINSITDIADGEYNMTVNVTNSSGIEVMYETNVNITIDNNPPEVVSINTPVKSANLSTGTQVFNATVIDAGTGVDTVLFNISNGTDVVVLTGSLTGDNDYNVSIDLSLLNEGAQNVTIEANDTFNQQTLLDSRDFTIDRTDPIVNITNVSINSTDSTPVVSYNYSDILSPVADCSLFVNDSFYGSNSSTENYTETDITVNSAIADGSYTANVTCTDSSGNQGTSPSILFFIDTTTPTVTINSPSNGANLSEGMQVFNVTVTDSAGVDSVIFNISNGTADLLYNTTEATLDIIESDYNVSVNISLLDEGIQNITVWANESYGQTNNSEYFTFTVDRTAPTIAVLNASLSSTLAEPIVSFEFNDSYATEANCSLYFNGNIQGSNTSSLNSSTKTDLLSNTLPAGTYTSQINCTDPSGNVGASEEFNLTVEASSESSSSSSSSGGGGSSGSSGAVSSTTSSSHKEVWASIYEGETAEVEIDNEIIAITSVDFDVTEDIYGPWIKVELQESEDLPSDVDEIDVTVQSYYYVQTASTLTNDVIENVGFEFQVALDWFEENDLSATEIAMHHFDEDTGVWSELVTVHTDSDDDYEYYTAEAEGFSYFAVALASDTIESLVSSVEAEAEEVAEEVEAEAEEVAEEAEAVEETSESAFGLGSILLVVAVILVILVAVILWKRARAQEVPMPVKRPVPKKRRKKRR